MTKTCDILTCDRPMLVKLNGRKRCLECYEADLRFARKQMDRILDDIGAATDGGIGPACGTEEQQHGRDSDRVTDET